MMAFSLVSIGSTRFDCLAVRRLNACALSLGFDLWYVLLDWPERHNMGVFRELYGAAAIRAAVRRAREFSSEVGIHPGRTLTWREAVRGLNGWVSRLETLALLYRTDRSFRNRCLSQIFSNLKPRLQRIGVRNQRDPLVSRAAAYLIEELAFKVTAFETGPFSAEFLPAREMQLADDLYSGRLLPPRHVRQGGFQVVICADNGVPTIRGYYGQADVLPGHTEPVHLPT